MNVLVLPLADASRKASYDNRARTVGINTDEIESVSEITQSKNINLILKSGRGHRLEITFEAFLDALRLFNKQ